MVNSGKSRTPSFSTSHAQKGGCPNLERSPPWRTVARPRLSCPAHKAAVPVAVSILSRGPVSAARHNSTGG